jgi:hypothetical protein
MFRSTGSKGSGSKSAPVQCEHGYAGGAEGEHALGVGLGVLELIGCSRIGPVGMDGLRAPVSRSRLVKRASMRSSTVTPVVLAPPCCPAPVSASRLASAFDAIRFPPLTIRVIWRGVPLASRPTKGTPTCPAVAPAWI